MQTSTQPTIELHTDPDAVRRLLAEERDAAVGRLAALTRDFDEMVGAASSVTVDDEHDPEGSTIAFERSQVSALADQARRHLSDLDDAEGRLLTGAYGRCESCGNAIGEARLEARPTATLCIGCASAIRH